MIFLKLCMELVQCCGMLPHRANKVISLASVRVAKLRCCLLSGLGSARSIEVVFLCLITPSDIF